MRPKKDQTKLKNPTTRQLHIQGRHPRALAAQPPQLPQHRARRCAMRLALYLQDRTLREVGYGGGAAVRMRNS